MTDKDVIKNNFSKYASYYDMYSGVQENCARKLIAMTDGDRFQKILDVGCGTGIYTGYLRNRFQSAHIKALDISEEMIRIARDKLSEQRIEFITGDAEEIDLSERFDLVTSNASLQWFSNVEKALLRYKKILTGKGVILFSTFGPHTFCELHTSLEKIFGKHSSVSSTGFMGKGGIRKILKTNFNNAEMKEEIRRERFDSLKELLKKIKYSGIRGYGVNKKGIWTPKIIEELERTYKEDFPDPAGKGIRATYQVFFCKGIK